MAAQTVIMADDSVALERLLPPYANDDAELIISAMQSPKCMKLFAERAKMAVLLSHFPSQLNRDGSFILSSQQSLWCAYLSTALSHSENFAAAKEILNILDWTEGMLFSVGYNLVVGDKYEGFKLLVESNKMSKELISSMRPYSQNEHILQLIASNI